MDKDLKKLVSEQNRVRREVVERVGQNIGDQEWQRAKENAQRIIEGPPGEQAMIDAEWQRKKVDAQRVIEGSFIFSFTPKKVERGK